MGWMGGYNNDWNTISIWNIPQILKLINYCEEDGRNDDEIPREDPINHSKKGKIILWNKFFRKCTHLSDFIQQNP